MQKTANAKDEANFVKQVPQHPRDRLARRIARVEDEVEVVRQIPAVGKVKKAQKKKLLHPTERKRARKNEIGTNNSLVLLENKNFAARIYLDKPSVFNLKKTREEKIIDRLIESIPQGKDNLYIKHMVDTNSFSVRKDKSQEVTEHLLAVLANADQKLNNSIDLTKADIVSIKAKKPRQLNNLKNMKKIY